nr:class I SAM-dependent methyltransferase [Corynebacterium lactis]
MSDTTSSAAPLTALDAIAQHVNATTAQSDAITRACESASEYGVAVPDAMTGSFLTAMMTLASARRDGHPAAVIASPAAGVVGLHLAAGLADDGVLTCIDPELEHQSLAKQAFRDAGIRPNRQRFLPSSPVEVMDRLAPDSYDLVYLDVDPSMILAAQEKAWPLLRAGGVLIIPGALLDGTVEDDSRTDRDTVAARMADQQLLELEGATVVRLPIAAGATVLLKK